MNTTEDKIKEAGKPSNILLWRKIYNILCRSCQRKIFLAGSNVKQVGTPSVMDRMQKVIDEELCSTCKNRIDLIIKNRRS